MPEQGTNQSPSTQATSPSSTSNGLTANGGAGANGGLDSPKWANQLSPELRQPSILRHKDLTGLAKDYLDLEKASLRMPGADATDEERSAFYTKLGRPESPDKYEIKFAEGTAVDQSLLAAFRGTAHKLGLSQQQAQALGEWWAGQAGAMSETQGNEIKGSLQEWDQQLTTDWGWQKERNIGLAARAFNMAVDGTDLAKPLAEFFDETGLGHHPLMIKFFHQLALKNGEDKLITAEGPTADDRQTAGEQIRAIRGDKDHPYNNPKHPSHQDAMRHMKALYDTMYAKEG